MKKILMLVLSLGLFFNLSVGAQAANWKMAHYVPVDSIIDSIAKDFIKEVEANTDIELDLFPAGQLGDWMEMSEQIMRGAIQIGIMPVNPSYNQALQLRVLPYMVMNWAEAKKAFTGDNPYILNIMAKEMEKVGLKALAAVAEGFGGLGYAEVPSFDPRDANANTGNLKCRVPGGNVAFESMAKNFGYIPTSVPWGEVYIALQTGMVGCQMGAQPYNTYASFVDVTKAWAQLNTHFQVSFLYMNLKLWNSLSDADKAAIQAAARKYADTSFDRAAAEDADYIKKMEEKGIKVFIPTDEQYAAFAEKIRTNTWPQLENQVGKETLDAVRAEIQKASGN